MSLIAYVADVIAAIKARLGDKLMTKVNVVGTLTALADERMDENLDPLNSIVDLRKVLKLDATHAGREQAWADFGGEGRYTGSAAQNKQMHTWTMEELAKGYTDMPKPGE